MRSSSPAKFALTTLVVCANAHCGKAQLTVGRLSDIFLGKAEKISPTERRIVRDILQQATPDLVDKAWKEVGGKGPGVDILMKRLANFDLAAKKMNSKSAA